MSTQRGKLLQNFMSPYISLRLEPEPPRAPAQSYLRSRLALRRFTHSYLYYLEHVHFAQPQLSNWYLLVGLSYRMREHTFLIFATCNLYTTEIHQYSNSPSTGYTRVQIVSLINLIDCLWFTPCSVLWTSRRSRTFVLRTHWSTDRILMATINDYLMDNNRPPKEYFSTLKDIQLFSTGSHCCAQLVSF